ncbi:MAG: hypothetical protein ACT4OK_02980 [Gemmobacter sp.]
MLMGLQVCQGGADMQDCRSRIGGIDSSVPALSPVASGAVALAEGAMNTRGQSDG